MTPTRSSVTSWLEVGGLLLLTAAAALFVARWTVPGALATAGVLLIAASALLTWRRGTPVAVNRGVEVE